MRSLVLFLSLLAVPACNSPSGRIKTSGEPVGVDQRRGGTAVYDEITADTLEKLLDRHRRQVNVQNERGYLVAFYDRVEEVLLNSGLYRMVSMRFVERAKQEANLVRTEDLFIEKYWDAFLANLHKEGLSPDFFIWGTMTTQTSDLTSNMKERRYRMSLEMIGAKESGERIKEYRN